MHGAVHCSVHCCAQSVCGVLYCAQSMHCTVWCTVWCTVHCTVHCTGYCLVLCIARCTGLCSVLGAVRHIVLHDALYCAALQLKRTQTAKFRNVKFETIQDDARKRTPNRPRRPSERLPSALDEIGFNSTAAGPPLEGASGRFGRHFERARGPTKTGSA